MRTPAAVVLAAVVALSVGGCGAPTTTYSTATGDHVTVEWKNYPGHAVVQEVEPTAIPERADIETAWTELNTGIEADLSARFGYEWHVEGGTFWSAFGGNGYGGDSMYTSYTSAIHTADGAPQTVEGWYEVLDMVSEHTRRLGIGALQLDYENESGDVRAATVEHNGTDDPEKFWMWWASAAGPSHSVHLNLVDVDRDLTGKAAESWGDHHRSIAITYIGTTVADHSRAAYADALRPFSGLERPERSTSN